MRRRVGWLLPILLTTLPALGQEPFHPAESPPETPSEWTPSPGPWIVAEEADLVTPSGAVWQIVISERRLGTIPAGRTETPLLFPRVAFRRILSTDTVTAAIMLPTGNRGVGFFPEGSPEEENVPPRIGSDDIGRWPNACRLSILDASGAIDLDRNGACEIALRRFCSCSAPSCAGILLVELNEEGPTVLDPVALVDSVRLGRVVLERILPGEDPATPILQIAPEVMEGCRFVALLGIRGSSDCADCCRFPVFLRPRAGGAYGPFYDPDTQALWLKRAKDDIAAVAAGNASRPLLSLEEAQVARAAAFFYFTGAGRQTLGMISDGLGVRSRGYRTQELLRRIEELFLTTRPEER